MSGEVCFVNIDDRGVRRRRIVGIVMWAVAMVLVAALVVCRAPRAARLIAFAPFWIGALGIFQASEKTCVSLAARGMRERDGEPEAIEDALERDALKRQARRVHLKAIGAAVIQTGLGLLLP